MGDLTGRTALVTGASRGIGRSIAERLAADGARVAVHYHTAGEAAERTLTAIERAGGHAFLIRADLGTGEGIDAVLSTLREQADDLDILVNNAAMMSKGRDRIDSNEFDRIFAVNVKGPFFLIQRVLPFMADGGRIITISSASNRIAIGDFAYAMTKGAIDVMGRVLANSLGERGITINTVAPGLTATDMSGWLDRDIAAAIARFTALGRVGHPRDIADVVAYLASDDARWITGQVIDVSGGLWLGPPGPGNPWLSLKPPSTTADQNDQH
jgi:NAD(P)-dependent dehydrogenase (short-subunit alcohol dehydrogenase family)